MDTRILILRYSVLCGFLCDPRGKKIITKYTTERKWDTKYFVVNIMHFGGSFATLVVKKITTKNTRERTRDTKYFVLNIVHFVGSFVILVVKKNNYKEHKGH